MSSDLCQSLRELGMPFWIIDKFNSVFVLLDPIAKSSVSETRGRAAFRHNHTHSIVEYILRPVRVYSIVEYTAPY
jgi:hypothetical protein